SPVEATGKRKIAWLLLRVVCGTVSESLPALPARRPSAGAMLGPCGFSVAANHTGPFVFRCRPRVIREWQRVGGSRARSELSLPALSPRRAGRPIPPLGHATFSLRGGPPPSFSGRCSSSAGVVQPRRTSADRRVPPPAHYGNRTADTLRFGSIP